MQNAIVIVLLSYAMALLQAGLFFSVFNDPYIEKEKRRIFLGTVVLTTLLLVQNEISWQLEINGSMPFARTASSIFGYTIRPLIIVMFCCVIETWRRHRIAWVLVVINALVYLTALFSDVTFSIDANNDFHRGPLGFTCHIVSAVLLIYLLWISLRRYRDVMKWDAAIPIFASIVIIAATVVDSLSGLGELPASFLTISVVVCSVFFYIWLHLQFVREHENDLAAQQRIRIMMTQIQPHFLNNTLATVKALCAQDPVKAAEVTDKLARYLRQNMDSLDVKECIPFEKELSHTRLYADIESVRFENVRVQYEIREMDFEVPPLSVQPLVENAIRHGVRIREEGLVWVQTEKKEDAFEVRVRDNGIGFDASALEEMDSSHVGIRNVRERIEKMCKGTLEIESNTGEGTAVIIRIPDRKERG